MLRVKLPVRYECRKKHEKGAHRSPSGPFENLKGIWGAGVFAKISCSGPSKFLRFFVVRKEPVGRLENNKKNLAQQGTFLLE